MPSISCSNPTIRYLYYEDDPLSPASLTAIRTVIAAGGLAAAIGYDIWKRNSQPAADAAEQKEVPAPTQSAGTDSNKPLLARTLNGVVPAGIELGMVGGGYVSLMQVMQASPKSGHTGNVERSSCCDMSAVFVSATC
jgi:hypothetical protein